MGMRVGLKISGESCPVARETVETDVDVTDVNRARIDGTDTVVEEVVFDGDANCTNESFTELFSSGGRSSYRYDRRENLSCACDMVEESLEHPISSIRIRNGTLYVTVNLDELEDLPSLIETLREDFDSVTVCKIDHSNGNETEDLMTFDREELTPRQREVYHTAYEKGYFEHTRRATASEIADELGIAVSTFTEHMSIIQSKIADAFFNDGDYY